MTDDSDNRMWSGEQDRPASWRRPSLAPRQRDEIRRRLADGEQAAVLALEFGVSRRTIDAHKP